ncbi:glycoside hydrolase family 3 C-terminal domain-containing protein [Caldicellulosiruptoraceae bacterium PP1]
MNQNIKEIISQMTLEEKISLCSGEGFWHTKAVERLGVEKIMVSDGPHGLRKQKGKADNLGIYNSVNATCFPTASCLASTWDTEAVGEIGKAIGEECQAEGVSVILGPGVNIKRTPLCGRNFEYFSEDPYLASHLAASYIKGVQSQGVGTSIKHFAVNNQEYRRMAIDAVADERTLREIYLAAFEYAIKEGKPWTIMAAYNRVNGDYCTQNHWLLTKVLREEWGYEGLVVSDWGAVDERAKALKAGLDLEMPSSNGFGENQIRRALQNGEITEEDLDKAVERVLELVFKGLENKKKNATYDKEKHHELAKKVAREGIVLLKNQDNILPLKKEGTIAIIGEFAKNPRFEGGGSSHVNPTKIDIAFDEIAKITENKANLLYARGYKLDSTDTDNYLINQAIDIAKQSDVAVIFAGLPEIYESEGYDRKDLSMPKSHNILIEEIAKVNKNVVVVLMNGAPIEMPWVDKVKGIFECYLGGQAVSGAIAEILFGLYSPCGKLPETFPLKLSHTPAYLNYPGDGKKVEYKEGVFVGYRYYDTKGIDVLFPFGYGLSYTNFEYSDIKVDKKEIKDTETVKVSVKVKNTGSIAGKEIIQLYVRDIESSVQRPLKELKGFKKVYLAPDEETEVSFELDKRAFAYYNEYIKDWFVETGDFEIMIGKSSKDIVLSETIKVISTTPIKKVFDRNSTIAELMDDPKGKEILNIMWENMKKNAIFSAFQGVDMGIALTFMKEMPLRGLVMFGAGHFTEEMMNEMINKLNE